MTKIPLLKTGRLLAKLVPGEFGKHTRRYFREELQMQKADAVFVSFPRSGRTWIRTMLAKLFTDIYGFEKVEMLEFDNLFNLNPSVPRILFTHERDALGDTFSQVQRIVKFSDKPLILLVRNPIDVAVSFHFFLNNRGGLASHIAMAEGSLEEFVLSANGVDGVIKFLNNWATIIDHLPAKMVVRYEDMHDDPQAALSNFAKFLNINASDKQIVDAVEFTRFEKLKKMERTNAFDNIRLRPSNLENPDSFKVRRGKKNGYRDYFSDEIIEQLEEKVRNNLAPRYGYSELGSNC